MYANNLILDLDNRVAIPQNEKDNYIIKNSSFMDYCIEIYINPHNSVDLINLYLIIKSYSCSILFPSHNFFTLIKNLNEKEFIASNININEFKNMSYFSFNKWFYTQLKNDWKYIKQNGEYYILFSYPVELFDRNNLAYLKPKYPWDTEIILKIIRIVEQTNEYEKLIKKQKEKINELEVIIAKLRGEK